MTSDRLTLDVTSVHLYDHGHVIALIIGDADKSSDNNSM